MTLEWKSNRDGSEHVYWSQFSKEGDIGLVSKFKTKPDGKLGDGYFPEAVGPFVADGYTYTAVQKTGFKTGKKYWDIERVKTGAVTLGEDREEVIAHNSVKQQEYAKPAADYWKSKDEAIAKAHAENLAEAKRQSQALENLNDTMTQILVELRRIADAQAAKLG